MSRDSFTRTTREGWWTRIKNSAGGTFLGFLIFLGCIALLWWNEGRAVQTAKSLDEGFDKVVNIRDDSVDSNNDYSLVHLSGNLETDEVFLDQEFEIEVEGIRIKRVVEMYQWKEHKKSSSDKNVGGSKTTSTQYNYKKEWSSSLINSSNFEEPLGHENPKSMGVSEYETSQQNVSMGDFEIPTSLLDLINDFEPYPLNNLETDNFNKIYVIKEDVNGQTTDKAFISFSGSNHSSPSIGDIKVYFQYVQKGEYSLIAEQSDDSFAPYQTEAGDQLYMINKGKISAKEMFTNAQSANTFLTWMFRIVGTLLMFAAFNMIGNFFGTLGDLIPIVGSILRFGIGVVSGLFAFVFSLTSVALAWIYYRPILGVILLLVVAGTVLFFYKKSLDERRV